MISQKLNQFFYSAWGKNQNGQLGDGSSKQRTCPVAVDADKVLKNQKIIRIAAGYAHCLAVNNFGRVFAWGNNPFGQLG